MSQTNRSDAPLFQVRNHHSAACGAPPHIDDLRPNQYLGYFENQYGEQAVFVYDRDSSQAVLYLGDAGWQPPHVVIDGMVPDLVLAETERHWVPCLLASRHSEPKGGLNMIDNPATVAGLRAVARPPATSSVSDEGDRSNAATRRSAGQHRALTRVLCR